MDTIDVQGQTYVLASYFERLVGQFLDGVFYLVILVVPTIVSAVFLATWMGATAGAVLAFLYLFFQDGLGAGESYGKRILRTRVIGAASGDSCTFVQSFIRNLLLVVLGFIDWIFIFIGSRRQRLGDRAAGTVVIKLEVPTEAGHGE